MKGTLVVASALAALLSTAPAFAAAKPEPTATATDAATAPRATKPTRYCFDTETTGSRIAKRECRTRDEWRALGVEVPSQR